MRLKIIPTLLLALSLLGCSATTSVPLEVTKPVYHPAKPLPVVPYSPQWKVMVVDGQSYVAMSYSDSVRYRIWLEDVKRYIQSQNTIICGYRSELNETSCK